MIQPSSARARYKLHVSPEYPNAQNSECLEAKHSCLSARHKSICASYQVSVLFERHLLTYIPAYYIVCSLCCTKNYS